MEEITDLSYESIVKYFTTLQQFGYKSYEDVYKLVALIGLEEMLDIFAEFITEEDLKQIVSAINCLSGTTCLIDFPTYSESESLIHKSKVNYLTRLSEADSIRMGNDSFRILEQKFYCI